MMVATAVVCRCRRIARNGDDRVWSPPKKETFTKLDSHQFWSRCVVFPLLFDISQYFSSLFLSHPLAQSVVGVLARFCCDFIFPSIAHACTVRCSSFNAGRSLTSLSSSSALARLLSALPWNYVDVSILSVCRVFRLHETNACIRCRTEPSSHRDAAVARAIRKSLIKDSWNGAEEHKL